LIEQSDGIVRDLQCKALQDYTLKNEV